MDWVDHRHQARLKKAYVKVTEQPSLGIANGKVACDKHISED